MAPPKKRRGRKAGKGKPGRQEKLKLTSSGSKTESAASKSAVKNNPTEEARIQIVVNSEPAEETTIKTVVEPTVEIQFETEKYKRGGHFKPRRNCKSRSVELAASITDPPEEHSDQSTPAYDPKAISGTHFAERKMTLPANSKQLVFAFKVDSVNQDGNVCTICSDSAKAEEILLCGCKKLICTSCFLNSGCDCAESVAVVQNNMGNAATETGTGKQNVVNVEDYDSEISTTRELLLLGDLQFTLEIQDISSN